MQISRAPPNGSFVFIIVKPNKPLEVGGRALGSTLHPDSFKTRERREHSSPNTRFSGATLKKSTQWDQISISFRSIIFQTFYSNRPTQYLYFTQSRLFSTRKNTVIDVQKIYSTHLSAYNYLFIFKTGFLVCFDSLQTDYHNKLKLLSFTNSKLFFPSFFCFVFFLNTTEKFHKLHYCCTLQTIDRKHNISHSLQIRCLHDSFNLKGTPLL